MSEKQKDLLDILTTFNINARYADYKRSFYKKSTEEYTEKYIEKIKEMRIWLLNELDKIYSDVDLLSKSPPLKMNSPRKTLP